MLRIECPFCGLRDEPEFTYGGESQVTRIVEVEPWSRIPERRYALIDYDL